MASSLNPGRLPALERGLEERDIGCIVDSKNRLEDARLVQLGPPSGIRTAPQLAAADSVLASRCACFSLKTVFNPAILR